MKRLVILGAGCGGTMMANKLRKDLDDDWSITLIDKDNAIIISQAISRRLVFPYPQDAQ